MKSKKFLATTIHEYLNEQQEVLLAPNGNKSNLTKNLYYYVRTDEFKKQFGDQENNPNESSKVIDENGEPLIVYHGTPYNFEYVDFKITNRTKRGWNNIKDYGIFFTNSIFTAKQYAIERPEENKEYIEWCDELEVLKKNQDYDGQAQLYNFGKDRYKPNPEPTNPKIGKVIECFLNIRKPYIKDAKGSYWFNVLKHNSHLTGEYDGAIYLNMIEMFKDVQNTYIVFDKNQIKTLAKI